MPVTKRGTKIVSYNEQNDDDDFIPIVDNTKKSRTAKSNDVPTTSKSDSKQPAKIREEKKSIFQSEKPLLIVQPVAETAIGIEEKENTSSPPTASSEDEKSPIKNATGLEKDDEPKSKRMKHSEEDSIKEHQSDDENASPQLQPYGQMEESETTDDMLSFDPPTSRASSTRQADLPARRASAPLGFPTSKINIPSPHVPRVGLSRKSATVKPLHPTFTSRVVHE